MPAEHLRANALTRRHKSMDRSGSGSRRRFMSAVAASATLGSPLPLLAADRSAGGGAGAMPMFDVRRFGAVGDGRTMATAAIQKAIDAAGKAGGGFVLVPPGRYLSGALFLRSNVRVYVTAGATLVASSR